MANLLADPNLWADNGGTTPAFSWNGTSYVQGWGEGTYDNAYLVLQNNDLPAGNRITGTILIERDPAPSEPMSTDFLLDDPGAKVTYESIEVVTGVLTPFDWEVPTDTNNLMLLTRAEYGTVTVTITPGGSGPEPPVGPSYNCECEDVYDSRTLGALRAELASRLNFSDEQGSAPPRTLAAMRESLHIRLGYSDQVMTEGMGKLLAEFLRDAQETLYRRFEMDRYGEYSLEPFVDPEDTTSIDPQAVFLLALANAKAHFGKGDAKAYYEQLERYIGDLLLRRPPNLKAVLNSLLRSAQEALYRRYDVLRTERIYAWDLVAGVRFYDLDGNSDTCPKRFDPRKVRWVGIERDGFWAPLACGIPPELYSHNQTGRPTRYEIRQCIEIWPAPDSQPGKLRIKGHFELGPFADDDDVTTIDAELVFLLALANAKTHYKQPGGADYIAQLETMIHNLVAGSHHTTRYIHGQRVGPLDPDPIWTTGTWPPPT